VAEWRPLSPYDFWQYFRNTEDADVGRFLKVFTRLPLDEIARLEALGGSEINEAKKILATEATAVVHGREAADAASETARKTFEEGTVGGDLPTLEISRAELDAGAPASGCSSRRALSRRTARPGVRSRAAACVSTMHRSRMRKSA
jgi:tyrosyl-tRNA synthetase